jgi:LmbE family N-acetylglucosaminyl deacetylase
MNAKTEFFVYDGKDVAEAMKRTTHMAVSAHFDDIEFMAYPPIEECFGQKDKGFGAVVLTDGAGSPRSGIYAGYTDGQMKEVRIKEQKKAAFIGEYSFLAALNFTSAEVKDAKNKAVAENLAEIIERAAPQYIFTHNPADRHDTHVATFLNVLRALNAIDKSARPKKLYGCEVWRGLDWVCDEEKLRFDCGGRHNLATALADVFDSQISGGKDYAEAVLGRRKANATFADDHAVDGFSEVSYAIDMTELIGSDTSAEDFITKKIENFKNDVAERLRRLN